MSRYAPLEVDLQPLFRDERGDDEDGFVDAEGSIRITGPKGEQLDVGWDHHRGCWNLRIPTPSVMSIVPEAANSCFVYPRSMSSI